MIKPTKPESKGLWETPKGLSHLAASQEAARCMYCFDAPCVAGCPVGIDIPEFVARIRSGNIVAASRIILEKNLLGAVCARVCPVEELCEKNCSRAKGDKPVKIGLLQRYALEQVRPVPKTIKRNGIRAAVVGAGPSGLAAAHRLAGAGVKVTVYEKEQMPGGTARWGIPLYRLPKDLINEDVKALEELGVQLKYNCNVDEGKAREILEEFDFVYVASGLGKPQRPALTGIELADSAEKFLTQVNTGKGNSLLPTAGQDVAVIGGGNTALDAACTAKRMGAERVVVVYRRSKAEMPAWHEEYMAAVELGVEFRWLTTPTHITGNYQGLKELHCLRMKLGDRDESGRRAPSVIPGSEFTLKVHFIYWATGQQPNVYSARLFGLETDERGLIKVNANGQTSNPKVFAGGDLTNGGMTVVHGVRDGINAAEGILNNLTGRESE